MSQNQELIELVSRQLLQNENNSEVKLIRSEKTDNDNKLKAIITSMK